MHSIGVEVRLGQKKKIIMWQLAKDIVINYSLLLFIKS